MSLWIITAIISAILIGIGFIVNEKNAKYILSGYNTMSEEERKNTDLKGYLSFFKKGTLILGISLFILVIGISSFSPNAAGIVLVLYPLCAGFYFSWRCLQFFPDSRKTQRPALLVIGSCVLLFVLSLLFLGFHSNKLKISDEQISISGIYSESIPLSEVENISIASVPKISLKTNGFALGDTKKGYFKTADEEIVKLILNNDKRPVIVFKKKNGERVFYSDASATNEKIFHDLKNSLTGHKNLFSAAGD